MMRLCVACTGYKLCAVRKRAFTKHIAPCFTQSHHEAFENQDDIDNQISPLAVDHAKTSWYSFVQTSVDGQH